MMLRFLNTILIAVATAVPIAAQTADSPRFPIDSIVVEGLRHGSERVVVAESRLQPGREYSESELRAGAARAARLPFVVRVDMRIERGEQRGSYRLVLAVTEAKPLFLGVTFREGDDDTEERNLTAGGRLFVGRSGMLHGGVTGGDDRNIQLGYTQYDLFGTGTSVTAIVERRKLQTPPASFIEVEESDHITTQLIAGVPLRGNHALRGSFIRQPTVIRSRGVGGRMPFRVEHITTVEAAWIYDSTDDRLTPTTGTSIVTTASLRRGPYVPFTGTAERQITHYTRPSFGVDGRHHWDLRPRHSVWAGAEYRHSERGAEVFNQIGRSEMRTSTFTDAAVESGYAFMPWSGESTARLGDLRLEARLRFVAERGTIPGGGFDRDRRISENTTTASVGVIFRNAWAVVRVHLDAVAGGGR